MWRYRPSAGTASGEDARLYVVERDRGRVTRYSGAWDEDYKEGMMSTRHYGLQSTINRVLYS